MKRAILAGLLLATAPIAALSAQVWDATFARTQQGHSLGNPQAETKLITFVSYTCPHCAAFETEADALLRLNYVQPGKLNLEVRHVIRNPVDLAAALTTECGAEGKFWGNHRLMLSRQQQWLEKAIEAQPAQTARWTSGTMGSRMRAIASDLGFHEMMEPRGYTAAQLDQCLGDEAAMQDILAREAASKEQYAVTGTPSFALNGQLLAGVHNWAALRPRLNETTAP